MQRPAEKRFPAGLVLNLEDAFPGKEVITLEYPEDLETLFQVTPGQDIRG